VARSAELSKRCLVAESRQSNDLCFHSTAKANNLEPYAYLRHVFTELPQADTVDAIEAFLPVHLVKDQIRPG